MKSFALTYLVPGTEWLEQLGREEASLLSMHPLCVLTWAFLQHDILSAVILTYSTVRVYRDLGGSCTALEDLASKV